MSEPALPYAFAKRHGVAVLAPAGAEPQAVLREGSDPVALVEVRRVLGRPVRFERVSAQAFDGRLSEIYGAQAQAAAAGLDTVDLGSFAADLPAAADLLDPQDDAPIVRLINGVIAEAVRRGASDIHVEPFETGLTIRLRIDGVLREMLSLPGRAAPMLVSRIKVMSRLDIAEKRLPQDGRIGLTFGGRTVDVRVSTLPSRGGERVVLRILDKGEGAHRLADLGMSPGVLAAFEAALREPNGILLVTGPTGSGKTTTLYASLATLDAVSRNILTIEDPIEYAVAGVGQTQVNPKVGMTFAAGLRAILRQDPDVVMVGEIRDPETVKVAVQASLTGQLVLSTVHTNSALGAITRLRNLGVEPFLLASTVRMVIAQRLVRRLCPACKTEAPADAASARLIGVEPGTPLARPCGCPACGQTGYAGRIGVFEAARVDDRLRRMINDNADEQAMAAYALVDGQDLAGAARACVLRGETTVEEALRISRIEPDDGV